MITQTSGAFLASEVFVEIDQFAGERVGYFPRKNQNALFSRQGVVISSHFVIIKPYFHSLRCDMIKVIRTTESYSFIGSWNRFMVSGYFAWEKQDSQ